MIKIIKFAPLIYCRLGLVIYVWFILFDSINMDVHYKIKNGLFELF